MTVTTKTLHSIQRAGTAVRDAQLLLAEDVGRQALCVSEVMAADPFNLASDEQFETWKTVARMARAIGAMEEQLKTIYFAAVDLHNGRRLAQPLALGLDPAQLEQVIDAEQQRPRATSASKPPRAKGPDVAARSSPRPRPVRGNAAAVLEFLKTKLTTSGFDRVTHADLASGAAIALGSVGFAIASLKSKGLLAEGEKGHYRLLKG